MNEAAPLVHVRGLVKQYQGLRPLRIADLQVASGEHYAIAGLDQGAAEAFVLLVTGAAVPDEGEIRVAGRSTRDIATDTEWLLSLDRLGIVTRRAVLIEALSIASNLALPMTLSIDPIPPDTAARIDGLAAAVGLPAARLSDAATTMTPAERVRVHLARALALDPMLLLLEHPTTELEPDGARAFGEVLRGVSATRDLAWIALTEDEAFADASGGKRLRLQPATGKLAPDSCWRRFW